MSKPAASPRKPLKDQPFTEEDAKLLMAIYEDIVNIDEKRVFEAWEKWAENVKIIFQCPCHGLRPFTNISIACSTRNTLRLNGSNFGWKTSSHCGKLNAGNLPIPHLQMFQDEHGAIMLPDRH
jgi:hypothetical protein